MRIEKFTPPALTDSNTRRICGRANTSFSIGRMNSSVR
jgi:hypothetical protein